MRSSEIETLGALGGAALARFGKLPRDVHPAVYAQIRGWLTRPRRALGPAAAGVDAAT